MSDMITSVDVAIANRNKTCNSKVRKKPIKISHSIDKLTYSYEMSPSNDNSSPSGVTKGGFDLLTTGDKNDDDADDDDNDDQLSSDEEGVNSQVNRPLHLENFTDINTMIAD